LDIGSLEACPDQTRSGATEYAYDIYNRAVEVKAKDGHAQRNHYDAIGLRAGTEQDGEVSRYIFRGWSVVGELDGENRLKAREVRRYGCWRRMLETRRTIITIMSMGMLQH